MEANRLLESYLHQLRLPGFARSYRVFAEDALRNQQDPIQFLLALAEQEVSQRQQSQRQRLIKAARFPMLKELADFDFSAVPNLNKAAVLDFSRGAYLVQREPLLLVGNPGLGKTHLA